MLDSKTGDGRQAEQQVERGGSIAQDLDDEIPFGPEWRG
jgi:hypothetical protein